MRTKVEEKDSRETTTYLKILVMSFLALGGVIIWIVYFNFPPGWDFRNNLYLPVYLLLQGQSPYNIHVLVEGSNAVWLPTALGVFLPFGFLNLQQASNLWWLINIGALIALIFITTDQKRPQLLQLILALLLIIFFPSTVSHLNLGQISILICLAFVLVTWFGERLPDWVTGFLFAFAFTKPQLALLFVPTYFYVVWRKRGWSGFWKSGLWTLAGVIFLCLPVMIIRPDWYLDFISNLEINQLWAHPSIHYLFFSPLGLAGKILGWIFIIAAIGTAFYGVARWGRKEGFLWSLALTPVVTPYIWSWDFVFLYPLMVFSLFRQKSLFKSFLLFGGYSLILAGYMAMKFSGQIAEYLNWWVPWSVVAVSFIFRVWIDKKGEN